VQQPPPVTPLITETVTPPTAEYPSLSLLTSPAEIATWDDDAVYPPAESLMVDLPDDTLILTAVEFSDYGIEEIDENVGDTLELDPTFAAQIAATTQQDYSRRAGLLTTRLIATYEWQGGIT
jgi:hypothetical protein